MSSRLCHGNSTSTVTRLSAYVNDEYEEGCDGSFHARRHMLLLLCAAILSALPDAVPRSAILKWEYHMWDALALDNRRMASLRCHILGQQVLHLLIQYT
jgi:hypothetical protein